ncbi:MAG: acetoacetate decarboxylase family protein [Syntrophales bacterium]|nr:acetoacetate decarboxylase family protein [Syntrophales bacterium]
MWAPDEALSSHEYAELSLPPPLRFFNATSLTAIYTAKANEVKKLIPHADLHPVELIPHRALIAFSAFIYHQTDIGPYKALSISLPVTEKKRSVPLFFLWQLLRRKSFSLYVWQLPVTTEMARLNGYPKFMAHINFIFDHEQVACNVSVEETNILTLTGRRLPARSLKPMEVTIYSMRERSLLKGHLRFSAATGGWSLRADTVILTLGEHAIAQKLRRLKMSNDPLYYLYLDRSESVLSPPRYEPNCQIDDS